MANTPRVVIIGGGFAGLKCARALRRANVSITLLDRSNHHVFQPLLYQVATAGLAPSQIAAPIRGVLSSQRNCRVELADVTRIDAAAKMVFFTPVGGGERSVSFDYLVIAAGATHSYFGHEDWARVAPGLKTIEDALDIRRRFLLAFERAEQEHDDRTRQSLLTFVIVGAGPTGVETAGAMKEIAIQTLRSDFRSIDTSKVRVILIEAQDKVLPAGYPHPLSSRALRDLQEMGVDVRLNTRVVAIDAQGVNIESASRSERIESKNVIWAAGVRASTIVESLGVPLDKAGRVIVEPDLSIPNHPTIFIAGDLAHANNTKTNQLVPGVAPAAMQMGTFVGSLIARETNSSPSPTRPHFQYIDKGTLATIGRSRAVAHVFGINFSGFLAWVFWAGLHVAFLIDFRAKLLVLLDWTWSYVTFRRGSRLITGLRES
ncbi:MAG: NAD(P)/FAD-dependent oxidoreductase [Phycisphaerales bacterium]